MKNKAFDCVAMKHNIQRILRTENEGKTWEERNMAVREEIAQDPHLGKLLETLPGERPLRAAGKEVTIK